MCGIAVVIVLEFRGLGIALFAAEALARCRPLWLFTSRDYVLRVRPCILDSGMCARETCMHNETELTCAGQTLALTHLRT